VRERQEKHEKQEMKTHMTIDKQLEARLPNYVAIAGLLFQVARSRGRLGAGPGRIGLLLKCTGR
jgi:hypothetical protein